MSDKQTRDEWEIEKALNAADILPNKEPAIRLHSRDETPKHAVLKTLLAREIQRRGRRWDTEVKVGDGRVDVLDFGPVDERAVVYEIQTQNTPEIRQQKADQYVGGAVRDVLFIDPTEAPDTIGELTDWVQSEVVG